MLCVRTRAARRGTVVAAALVAACTSAPAAPTDVGSDGGPVDAPTAPLEWPELAVGTTVDPDDATRIGADARPPDLSCVGTWDFPAPGPERAIRGLVGFNLRVASPRSGICVHGYPDAVVTPLSACGTSDPISGDDGFVPLTALGEAPLSLRLFPSVGATPSASTRGLLGITLLPSDLPTFPSLDEATAALVFSVLEREEASGSAILFLGATDCTGAALYGTRMRVARRDGTYVESGDGPMDPLVWYAAASNLPSLEQPWSHAYGVASMINVPVLEAEEEVFVELWGRAPGEAEPGVVSCALVPIEASVVSGGPTRPRRASGPACPGLIAAP